MNNTATAIIAFVSGLAVGAAVTWKLTKTKYEQIANEEIASVKEVYSKRAKQESEESSDDSDPEPEHKQTYIQGDDPNVTIYDRLADRYKPEDDIYEKGETMVRKDEPYVITPDDFGSIYTYDALSLTYYEKDDILTDPDDNIISDSDDVVGTECLRRFGEFEPDVVFVRNDELMHDFEISIDRRRFSDVVDIRCYRNFYDREDCE